MSASAVVRWAAAVLLALYTVVIAKLTLQPAAAEQRAFSLLDRVATRLSNGRLDWSETEMLANIALFVPAGFLLAAVLGRVWASVLICAAASICIELAQYRYLPTRVPTIDDVQRNTIGAAIGAMIAWPLAHWLRDQVRAARRRPSGPPTAPAPWPSHASPGA